MRIDGHEKILGTIDAIDRREDIAAGIVASYQVDPNSLREVDIISNIKRKTTCKGTSFYAASGIGNLRKIYDFRRQIEDSGDNEDVIADASKVYDEQN